MSLKALGRQTFIYGFGHILTRLVTFLLLPFYTNILSQTEFGIISLIYTFLGFMTVILHYGLDASLLKHYVPAEREERTAILSNAYLSFVLTSLLFSVGLILLRYQVSSFIFGETLPKIVMMVAVIIFFDVLWSIHVLILRAEEKSVAFVSTSLLNVCLTLGLNIYFVVYLHEGVMGVVKSNLITSGILFIGTFPVIFSRISFLTLSKARWKKMMQFGMPFLPAGIFSMILELSDRYILKYLTDLETVGLYNAGYKLGMFMLLVAMGFNMGWQPYFLKKSKDETGYIAKIATRLLFLMGFFWVLLVFWSGELVQFKFGAYSFFGEEFWPAIKIVPFIAGAYVFHGLYLVQLPGVFIKEKTIYIAIVRGLGAVTNIILNFILIPIYGIIGAAAATCISFFLMAFTLFFINKKIFPVVYEWKNILVIFVSALGLYFLSINLDLSFMQKILMSLSFPIISLLLGVIRFQDVNILIDK